MIENERQLVRAYEWAARMIRQRDEALSETLWHESLRQDVADGIDAQRHKIEREIAEYLTAKLHPGEEAVIARVG